jgi:hypothetical protein
MNIQDEIRKINHDSILDFNLILNDDDIESLDQIDIENYEDFIINNEIIIIDYND